jgi:4-carboxymuconolactone decarboxylase
MLQVHFYVGAPMSTTAIGVLLEVFRERGIKISPIRAFDTTEDPEALYQRGLATRREIMGDSAGADLANGDEVDQAWDRYEVEYLWGSVWPRPGLTRQQRVLCTLTALMVVGRESPIAAYMRAAQNVGFTKAQIKELILQLTFYIGVGEAHALRAVAEEVFASS